MSATVVSVANRVGCAGLVVWVHHVGGTLERLERSAHFWQVDVEAARFVLIAIDEDGDVVDRFKRPARRIDASRAGVTDAPEAGAGFTNLATPPVQ